MIDINGVNFEQVSEEHPVKKAFLEVRKKVRESGRKKFNFDWKEGVKKIVDPSDPEAIPEAPPDNSWPSTLNYVCEEGRFDVTIYDTYKIEKDRKMYEPRHVSFNGSVVYDIITDFEWIFWYLVIHPASETPKEYEKWATLRKSPVTMIRLVDDAKDAVKIMEEENIAYKVRKLIHEGDVARLRDTASALGVPYADEKEIALVRHQLITKLLTKQKNGKYDNDLLKSFQNYMELGGPKLELDKVMQAAISAKVIRYYRKNKSIDKTGWYRMDESDNRVDLVCIVPVGKKKEDALRTFLENNEEDLEALQKFTQERKND